ncbi:MAG: 7-cyano-7-deazaguanine synthase QueC [Planctomycetes bacterium]|nr:7-cyano-7-deazaguanine synthase QueC [Planctomycetota bacterium]
MNRAVALLSGGLDSATAAAIVRSEGSEVFPLAVAYGQRHAVELEAARNVAKALLLPELRIVQIDLRAIGGSALTAPIEVPKGRSAAAIASDVLGAAVPITYVPARNTIFLSVALSYAETLGAFDLVIGANALDYSGYPDCRSEYLESFERMAQLATRAGLEGRGRYRVRAPLIAMTKAEIIRRAMELGVPLELTQSCYDPAPDGAACGACDACVLRRKGFEEAGVLDPTRYQTGVAVSPRHSQNR